MTPDANQYTFLDLLIKGGWVMVPLLVCSVLAIAVIIERIFWGLRRERIFPSALISDLEHLLANKRLDEARGRCRADRSSLARIVDIALTKIDRNPTELREAVEVAGKREALDLQRYLPLLNTIAAVTPLLGLLGTVIGIIDIFHANQLQGTGRGERLSGGISEALICTATGLSIAIPSLIAYRLLAQKAKVFTSELESLATNLIHLLIETQESKIPLPIKSMK